MERPSLTEARLAAQAQQRDVMILYTGTDWCPACIYLEKRILSQPAFEHAFGPRIIMVEEPLARTPEALSTIGGKEQERRLREMDTYRIKSLPCVVLMDAQGLPFAIVQGVEKSADAYIQRFSDALALKARRDEALAAAAPLSGVERARALVAALEQLPEALRGKYADLLREIETLDPGNTLGYHGRAHHEARVEEMNEAFRVMRQGFAGMLQPEQLDACRHQVEAFMAKYPDMAPELRQQCYRLICDGFALKRDWKHTYDYVLLAIEAAPETELCGQLLRPLKAHLEKHFPEHCHPGGASGNTAEAKQQ